MHMADSDDKSNYIDYDKETITVDGKTYAEEGMQFLYKNDIAICLWENSLF